MATATKERPILFNGDMVRAILSGRKTQTRRVIKEVPTFLHRDRPIMDWGLSGVYRDDDGRFWLDVQTDVDDNSHGELICPHGKAGDRLWVRETFCILDPDHWADIGLPAESIIPCGNPRRNACAYRAECGSESDEIRREYGYKWRPSIHMPRWASRLTLEITDVRVERLQEISEADAQSEGFAGHYTPPVVSAGEICGPDGTLPSDEFRQIWEQINGAGSWHANPWVWVVSFKRLEQLA